MRSLFGNRSLSLAAQHELAIFPIDADTLMGTQRGADCKGDCHESGHHSRRNEGLSRRL